MQKDLGGEKEALRVGRCSGHPATEKGKPHVVRELPHHHQSSQQSQRLIGRVTFG
ncbi:hypothetical protein DPMN_014991 [Dreissena polymorpha]|uniref:Uncharacterized protein n=1 Tax=Dreissena polymorpha TaxID=45954 RepID=A0A9D4NAA5_DREPO|nr:hypothetical protein DPMN_014991 [Dreissena polymorpha]